MDPIRQHSEEYCNFLVNYFLNIITILNYELNLQSQNRILIIDTFLAILHLLIFHHNFIDTYSFDPSLNLLYVKLSDYSDI